MTIWLEQYNMLQDGTDLGRRLRDFLQLIHSPPNLALTAKLTLQSLERTVSIPHGHQCLCF